MGVTAIIAAGGKGTRMGAAENKVFLELNGKKVIEHTVEIFEKNFLITNIVIVTGKNDMEKCRSLSEKYKKITAIVEGGNTRKQSVYNGLRAANEDYVAIHDAARALITDEIISETIYAAKKYGAAAPGVLCKDTLKKSDSQGFIESTVDRSFVYQIQTPQVFKKELIIKAHESAGDFDATDDCALVEREGVKIKITHGSYENIKLTTPDDMIIGENILKRRKNV
jgi:2-C-methyl-D-erythritol 4-phosphate cytidylyltransferase